MGDVAASGGYYISCGADKIFCQPTTLTGSIGIFGMVPNIEGLLDKHLGVTSYTIASNPNAIMSITKPFTPCTAPCHAKDDRPRLRDIRRPLC